METAQVITDVRKVEMYESKLVPNCGQVYTLFSLSLPKLIDGGPHRAYEVGELSSCESANFANLAILAINTPGLS